MARPLRVHAAAPATSDHECEPDGLQRRGDLARTSALMALIYRDRVQETSTTQGTGGYALDGAVLGYTSFDVIGSGNQCYYCAYASDDFGAAIGAWEVGRGTFGTRALTSDQILASSNNGQLINWGTGTRCVFVTFPAAAMGAQALPAHATTHQPGGADAMAVD